MKELDHQEIYQWYKKNIKEETYYCDVHDSLKPKYYALAMWPYPSGDAHMGHVRVYTLVDTVARLKKMQGYNVLNPLGWDSFGLPAENAAIKTGIHPKVHVDKNIDKMRNQQFAKLGLSVDWSKEMSSCDPDYYRWTQWLFLQFYKAGLAYRAESLVNYCPHDETVLANEQAQGGVCWRCGTKVEKRSMEQWFLRISDYAPRLWDDIEKLEASGKWSGEAISVQRNWINKSAGSIVKFPLELSSNGVAGDLARLEGEGGMAKANGDHKFGMPFEKPAYNEEMQGVYGAQNPNILNTSVSDIHEDSSTEVTQQLSLEADLCKRHIEVFTTRVDTIYGATAVVLAPEHPLVTVFQGTDFADDLESYINQTKQKSEMDRLTSKEKTGIKTKFTARHPLTDEKLPIFVADYVLGDYATGSVMCVPSHCLRDYEFAQKYGINQKKCVKPNSGDISEGCFEDEGVLFNSGEFSGLKSHEAKQKITQYLEKQGLASFKTTYKLKDWSISRQRYWGCPIPFIHCDSCGTVPVPDDQLPVILPQNVELSGGKADISSATDFLHTNCPKCNGPARREKDTMDTFICSSWYAFRYPDNKNDKQAFDSSLINRWMPLDFYIGGLEHAAQHMIYFRFFNKLLKDIGLVEFDEPVDRFYCNGMVLKDGAKMSKSKGNVVSPDDCIAKFGADSVRLYILSDTPAYMELDWSDKGLEAKHNFIRRFFRAIAGYIEGKNINISSNIDKNLFSMKPILQDFYAAINEIAKHLEDYSFNTAVAALHKAANSLHDIFAKQLELNEQDHHILMQAISDFTVISSIFMPQLSEYIWYNFLNQQDSIYHQQLPKVEEAFLARNTCFVAVQMGGKKIDLLEISVGASEEEVKALALAQNAVQKRLEGKKVLKMIYVKGKILNIVAQ